MISYLVIPFFAMQMLASATPHQHRRAASVEITSLEKNVTSTSGSGNVAAAGTLTSFGDIGVGCGINWKADVSYGGGLQAGSSDFGLGSGFTMTPGAITIGAGIGMNTANASANIQFTGAKNGSVELVFESSSPVTSSLSAPFKFATSTSKAAIRRICGLTAVPISPKLEREYQVSFLKKALDQGANLWNGGLRYGTPDSNLVYLMWYYFKKHPEDAENVSSTVSPEAIRPSVEQALEVLGEAKTIEIFEMARVDPKTPIEISVKALTGRVKKGEIGGIGLSEVNANTIRKSYAVHLIAAVEVELSLFTPDPLNNGIMNTRHEPRQDTIPISGSTNVDRVVMNSQLLELTEDMLDLQKAQDNFPVTGKRHGGVHETPLNG
ncbi:pyridoxal reductase [Stemphylium lycopersici]|uniref:Pyridoxal reductase n=1 Tax=Stemphylium lycopersici TaxID=183478 RepID=A0A364ND50_STELY|nr:pyridoxal reductase [Stemphylium lycopersici]